MLGTKWKFLKNTLDTLRIKEEKIMGLLDIICEYPRRVLTIFFVIETSGGMDGINISTVNSAIENVISDVKDIQSKEYPNVQIRIAVLKFSSYASWYVPEPIDIENFNWKHLEAGGLADLGAACEVLNEKLSRKEFMGDPSGCYSPIVILVSYREPTDDYIPKIVRLKNNNWFRSALKAAVVIGFDAEEDYYILFTGSSDAVMKIGTVSDLDMDTQLFISNFEKSIRFLTVESIKASLCNFNLVTSDILPKQDMLNEKIITFMKNNI
jgi:uncharacterized protein YegL